MSMNDRGQNMVEYLLLVIAVMIVMIALLAPNGAYQQRVANTLESATVGQINKLVNKIQF